MRISGNLTPAGRPPFEIEVQSACDARYRILDVDGIAPVAGMALMLVASTIFNTVKLYRAETLR